MSYNIKQKTYLFNNPPLHICMTKQTNNEIMCIYFTNVTISSSSRRSITFSSCLYISPFPFLEGSLGLQLKSFLIWEICICSCISCLIIMCKLHFFEFKKECHVLWLNSTIFCMRGMLLEKLSKTDHSCGDILGLVLGTDIAPGS